MFHEIKTFSKLLQLCILLASSFIPPACIGWVDPTQSCQNAAAIALHQHALSWFSVFSSTLEVPFPVSDSLFTMSFFLLTGPVMCWCVSPLLPSNVAYFQAQLLDGSISVFMIGHLTSDPWTVFVFEMIFGLHLSLIAACVLLSQSVFQPVRMTVVMSCVALLFPVSDNHSKVLKFCIFPLPFWTWSLIFCC